MVRSFVVLFITFVFLPSISVAYYENEMIQGYYQYHDESKEGKEYPRPKVPDDETLMSIPAQEFQELFTDTLNYALTVRNLDTYADYARLQEAAFRRSQEFASLQLLYVQQNPPQENAYNRRLRDAEAEAAIHNYLGKHKTEYGFVYFYSESCSYCAQQTPLLQIFQKRHGWEVEAVEIDQKPRAAAHFEVETTPSVYLVDRNRNIWQISNGLISLPELEERTYRYIRYAKGETDETSFRNILE